MDAYSAFAHEVHFEQIPIKNLVSNQEYQRNLSISHVQRTVANFDPYQINPVKLVDVMELTMSLTDNIQLKLSQSCQALVKLRFGAWCMTI